jgi:hypothetical protein
MSVSHVRITLGSGISGTVACVGEPPAVPLVELIKIHTGRLGRTAVCGHFKDSALPATAADTQALKSAGVVPPRAHGIRLVPISSLVDAVVTVVVNVDADRDMDYNVSHDTTEIAFTVVDNAVPAVLDIDLDDAESRDTTSVCDTTSDLSEPLQPTTPAAVTMEQAVEPISVSVSVPRKRRRLGQDTSVDAVIAGLHVDPTSLLPVQRWSLEVAHRAVLAHTDVARGYNVSRAAFGLVLHGVTGKRKGTQNTICHDEHLLALGLFSRVRVTSGGRRCGTAMSALRCVDWTKWLVVADKLGFTAAPPLGTPPPLPQDD